jgi:signal transduction histidine kinase/CheY-like chemotaxis protein
MRDRASPKAATGDASAKPASASHRVKVAAVVVLVNVAAVATIFVLWGMHVDRFWLGTSLLATLAALGGATPVRIPALKTSISTTDTFVLTALAAFGPQPACVVAAAGVLGSALGGEPHRKIAHMIFNLGNVVFSTGMAAVVYVAAGGVAGGAVQGQVLPLFAAALVYFVLNTGLVSAAVAIDTGSPFSRTWRESARWSGISASAGLPLATGLLWAIHLVGPSGLALGIPPIWLLVSFYRTHKERQERSQERIVQVEELNEHLEDKVVERTRDLQLALSQIEGANERLRTANDRLLEANRAKSEFLANVSHELRTPLNAIIGFSDLLGDSELDGRQREFVGDIHDSGDHLLNLINDILDLSKVEAGKMEARLETIDLPRAIGEAVAMVRPQAAKKNLELLVECAPNVQAAELDPGMFRQALVNLLGNGVKFTPDGGRVTVRAAAAGRDLLLDVEDTGIGIKEQDLGRIFDEFYQVDGSYSRTYEGTGLGLALVRRMLDMQNGTIQVRSTPGSGSSFACRFSECLREEPASLEPSPEPPALEPSSVDGRTVLVVEDNAVNRKLARSALRRGGFEVFEVCTGEEAIAWLRDRTPDLILMDIQLPGMDGLDVTRRLKADPRTAGLPVVALTAHAHEQDAQRAAEAGCVGYIVKPIRLSQFPRQVASYLLEPESV